MHLRPKMLHILYVWLPVIAYMVLIIILSSMPLELPRFPLPNRDKFVHFIEYGILGGLIFRSSRLSWPEKDVSDCIIFVIMVSTLFGATDEIHQSFVPGRSTEFFDMVADFIGSSVGALICAKVIR